ncbi:hypothetical protein C810_02312 [Lachnospiraceae bacterium A2]|nr:hypothetical protein C810_02312 [Lachnospiraceae bacterium A2]
MKRRFYFGLTVFCVLLMCFGLFGCGQSSADTASVPIEIGEHMNFGNYQGAEIEWRVLDVKDGNVLLLSEYGLDVKPYHDSASSDISWEACSLRQWLNGEFYESSFTDEEKKKIMLSTSEGFPEYNAGVAGGGYSYFERETEDNVFLLSYTEACHYISSEMANEGNSVGLCYPTEYAKSSPDIDIYHDACGWWLGAGFRGYADQCRQFVVSPYGKINAEEDASSTKYAVRPAMWIKWQEGPDGIGQGD